MLRKRWRWTVALAALILVFLVMGTSEFLEYSVFHPRTRFEPRSVSDGTYYYLDWRADFTPLSSLRAAKTPQGPLRTTRAFEEGGRLVPDPIGVVQAGLALHDQLLELSEGSPEFEERRAVLVAQLDWLEGEGAVWIAALEPPAIARAVVGDFASSDSTPVWPCRWSAARYGLDRVWISAIVQGQALSLFVRAAAFFDEPRYLAVARGVFHGFLQPDLGIVRWDAAGLPRLEEFPTEPPSEVLNGSLCAVLGIWDYARATGDSAAYRFAKAALVALDEPSFAYTHGSWTRYDRLARRPTSPTYQEIHAALAEAVAAITQEPIWQQRAVRWRAASSNPWLRSWIFVEVAWDKLRIALQGPPVPVRAAPVPTRVLVAMGLPPTRAG